MAKEANDFDDTVSDLLPKDTDMTEKSSPEKHTQTDSKRQEHAALAKRIRGRELTEQELNLWIAMGEAIGDL